MNTTELSNQFDLLYNNITSNQAPGLTEYEKSVFLTKGQDEIVKNYFTSNSKGNNIGQGFDDSAKRQADFTALMKTYPCTPVSRKKEEGGVEIDNPDFPATIDPREDTLVFTYPEDVYIIINETVKAQNNGKDTYYQVLPLRYDEYTRLMSKPYKRPVKNQVWRLINSGSLENDEYKKYVEMILHPGDTVVEEGYKVRYIRKPKPIIVGDLDTLTIEGYSFGTPEDAQDKKTEGCELDPILHEDILQRAVELAKIAWTQTGQDNTQAVMQAGQRSE